MYAFPGVLLEEKKKKKKSKPASYLYFPRSIVNRMWHPCLPLPAAVWLNQKAAQREPQWKESKTGGQRREWRRTLQSCSGRAGGKQPLCHSLGSQLSFYLKKNWGCAFPSAMEKNGGGQSTRRSRHWRGHRSKARWQNIETGEVSHPLQLPSKLWTHIMRNHH